MPWLPSIWLREIVHEGGLLRERMIRRIPLEHVGHLAERIRAAQRAGTLNPALEPAFLFHSIVALVMLPLATAKLWHSARGLPPIDRDVLHRHVRALVQRIQVELGVIRAKPRLHRDELQPQRVLVRPRPVDQRHEIGRNPHRHRRACEAAANPASSGPPNDLGGGVAQPAEAHDRGRACSIDVSRTVECTGPPPG